MRIQVTFELEVEDGDPDHEMGLTDEQYTTLIGNYRLPAGAYDVEVERVE